MEGAGLLDGQPRAQPCLGDRVPTLAVQELLEVHPTVR